MFAVGLAIVLSAFSVYRGMSMLFKSCIYFRLEPGDTDKLRPMTEAEQVLFSWYEEKHGHETLIRFLRRNAAVQATLFLLVGYLLLLTAFALIEENRPPGWAAGVGMWFLLLAVVTGLVAAVVVRGSWRQRTERPERRAARLMDRKKREPVWFVVVVVLTAIAVAVFLFGAILSSIFG